MPERLQIETLLNLYTIVETRIKGKKNWEKTVIINGHDVFIEVCQIEEYVTSALMIGDSLECRVVTNESIILMSTLVYNIKLVSNSMVLKIVDIQKHENKRNHKRYEISCRATFHKTGEIGEKYTVVNNVSLGGMSIITRDMLSKGDIIDLDIKCKNDCFVTLECVVVWVTQSEQNFFCGLSITYMDDRSIAVYKALIKKLQSKEQRKKQKLEQDANNAIRAKKEKR